VLDGSRAARRRPATDRKVTRSSAPRSSLKRGHVPFSTTGSTNNREAHSALIRWWEAAGRARCSRGAILRTRGRVVLPSRRRLLSDLGLPDGLHYLESSQRPMYGGGDSGRFFGRARQSGAVEPGNPRVLQGTLWGRVDGVSTARAADREGAAGHVLSAR
jgi:hypothetical protein